MPGDEGHVSLEFDPKNRKQGFQKRIRVVTNGNPREVILRVKGVVIPDPTVLRKRSGQLRMNRGEINFGKMLDTERKRDSIMVRNDSDHKMELGFDFSEVPSNFLLEASRKIMNPGETSFLKMELKGDKSGEYGFKRFRIRYFDKAYPDSTRGQLTISYNQSEDFSSWTAMERANAPRVKFLNKICNFGQVRKGETVECVYRFENVGKSPLIVRNIKLTSHIKIKKYDEIVDPGEQGEIVLLAETERVSGDLIRHVRVTTNSPGSQAVKLVIDGKVIAKKP